jgi:hypothetical protein
MLALSRKKEYPQDSNAALNEVREELNPEKESHSKKREESHSHAGEAKMEEGRNWIRIGARKSYA